MSGAKYDALLLDFDTVGDARPILASAPASPSNKNAVVFAVATETRHMEQALEDRAHFLLKRPIDSGEIRQTLHTAYDLMSREHRRGFRCAANLPVRLRMTDSQKEIFECSTLNVSGNGVAVRSPVALKLAAAVHIELQLPDGFSVLASGFVVWGDRPGVNGIKFQCSSPEARPRLDFWLDSQYRQMHK